ncbi:hypothetical protein O9992_21225 [Vibrio lentus]|nr:hypothetical protein [Vibrio lentus]
MFGNQASADVADELDAGMVGINQGKAAVVMLHGGCRNRVALVTTAQLTDTVRVAQIKVVSR